MGIYYLLGFLAIWSWLTILGYKGYKRYKKFYYKRKRQIEYDKNKPQVEWQKFDFELINVDKKIVEKILKNDKKNDNKPLEKQNYFDYFLEPYNDGKNYKVIVEDEWILGDLKKEDIEVLHGENITNIDNVIINKSLDNDGKFDYQVIAYTKKRVDR